MIAFVKCAVLSAVALTLLNSTVRAELPEIRVFGSTVDIVAEYERAGYWGGIDKGAAMEIPPYLTVATSPTWDKQAASLPVEVKKELFYRTLLPLVVYSNEIILNDRARLKKVVDTLQAGDRDWLAGLAADYGLLEAGMTIPEGEAFSALVGKLMTRVDAIPPSLALGQAAYESGYGTSRFAREGNALFGQWTYGGRGMQPQRKRGEKGDYAVAAYDWPLDSVRAYMRNLNTHRAYQGLCDKRAAARLEGRMPTGMELAETLVSYSERGLEYVKTLKGVMRANELAITDKATLRDAPAIIIIDVPSEAEVAKVKAEIAGLHQSGKLKEVLTEMGVDFD